MEFLDKYLLIIVVVITLLLVIFRYLSRKNIDRSSLGSNIKNTNLEKIECKENIDFIEEKNGGSLNIRNIGHAFLNILASLRESNKYGIVENHGEAYQTFNFMNKNSVINYEDKLKEIVNNFSIAKMIFSTPTEIYVDEAKSVIVRISKDIIPLNDLPNNNIIEMNIKISSFMKAHLISKDFKIVALNKEEQVIYDKDFTEWKWIITPITSKEKGVVFLRITVRIKLSDKVEEEKDFPVLERDIIIKIVDKV